jgi:hypothetical protein
MNKDTVIGIVGAVILVGAMVAVFVYERNSPAAQQAAAAANGGAFSLVTAAGPSAKDSVALGASKDATISIARQNLTNATFTLTWTAGSGKDTLSLMVMGPDGLGSMTATKSDTGKVTVTVPIPNAAPTPGSPTTKGVGDWKVTVKFESADPGLPVSPPVNPPVGTDSSVSWSVSTDLQGYEAKSG